MKTILLVALMLVGFIVQAQEMYLMKVTINALVFDYTYDDNWNLEKITSSEVTNIYEEDTLRTVIYMNLDWNYDYYPDSVVFTQDESSYRFVENKFIRGAWNVMGFWCGSVNMVKTISGGLVYSVDETLNDYPTVVTLIAPEFERTIYFEYNITTDVAENPADHVTVLQTDYFDMHGRKIPKPTKGFYIERKVTDKGIISTKHFIR